MSAQAAVAIEQLSVNTIRTLSMDAVQAANSGHPGTPMALAPVVYTLWQRQLRFDPEDPIWPDRDRFVLSVGHASMLLYSLLHLTGVKSVNPKYEVLGERAASLDDIRRFRQLDSKCPGHPEYRWTSGVETTTGPLGQGVATSVGMAMAGRWMADHFNRPGFDLFTYDVYALCGDGDMMEGVASEAASLAGHLKLANLCWIYDNNRITIEGSTEWAFSEDVATRFIAYGWNVTRVGDANEVAEAWRVVIQLRHQPVALVLSRQPLPTLDRSVYAPAAGVAQGAYVLADPADGKPEVILLASGSEVALCVQAYELLGAEGIKARVVSAPSWELFEQQDQAYRDSVLPPEVEARVSVEQAATFGWARFTGLRGERLGMRTFGASAPLKELQHRFGFAPEKIVEAARALARAG